ncbi:hypothetical protein AURDEDRAFT_116137 [Auricularia subglabra TFB-10046 SS5]|nr:hypothetical protein AURDEDRAFT_116137 [Auricularia subglabra TFB-10046 SS5]
MRTLARNVHYILRAREDDVARVRGAQVHAVHPADRGREAVPAVRARCKVPRYCSRACQRADWTGAGTAHKDLCRVFCKLNSASCTPANLAELEGALEPAFPSFDARDRDALRGIATMLCDHTGCRDKQCSDHHAPHSDSV